MPRDVAWPQQIARRSSIGWLWQPIRLWRLWRQRTRDRCETARLGERELHDIGVTRGDLYREFARRLRAW